MKPVLRRVNPLMKRRKPGHDRCALPAGAVLRPASFRGSRRLDSGDGRAGRASRISLGDNTNDNATLPGTNSQQATDALSKSFPDQANGSSPIVLHVSSGKLTDSKYSQAVNQAAADVAKAPDVASVVNPLTAQGASALSKDQRTGYLSVTLSVSPGALSVDDAQTIIDAAAKPAQAAGIQVETGGQLGQKVSKPSTETSELIGIIAAMVILTFTFGTVVAMLLPIVTAILGLASTLSIIQIFSHAMTVSTVAPTLATMIGLGVGIDYALFIVTRHFRGLKDGLDLQESIARAAATSGGAVAFAGGTVTIALVSLAVAGIPLVTTMGLMAAVAVVVAVLAALTLLPAMLAIIGPRINALRVRDRHPADHPKQGAWARWAAGVARRPVISTLVALAILIPLAIPLLSLTLGQKDVAALSTSTTARRAYDLISDNFGPGVNGPLLVAVSLGSPAQASSEQLGQLPGLGGQRPARQRPAAADAGERRLADPGRRGGHPGPNRQGRDHRLLQRDRHDRPGRAGHRGPRQQAALERDPRCREGHEHARLRRRQHRQQRGSRLGHLQQAPAPDPGRDRAQLPAADARVPHAW